MADVATLKRAPQLPTEASSSRDAIGAIIDSITAASTRETASARKLLDDIDAVMLQHAARIKNELEHFVTSIETVNRDTSERTTVFEKLKEDHARLVNARVAD